MVQSSTVCTGISATTCGGVIDHRRHETEGIQAFWHGRTKRLKVDWGVADSSASDSTSNVDQ